MSMRDALIAHLEATLAATPGLEGVKVVKSARGVDRLNKPTLQVVTRGYDKLPAAPLKKRSARFLCTLISPLTVLDDAETQLDDLLDLLLPALLTSGLSWQSADLTDWSDQLLAYDIEITSILT